jgi:hypothetical protein
MSERTDLIARLPWVTRLESTQDCDGYRYSAMSFKAFRDPVLREKYKCKAPARWRFRALKQRDPRLAQAQDGTYCWRHLFSLGLQHDMAEEARTTRGLEKLRKEAARHE